MLSRYRQTVLILGDLWSNKFKVSSRRRRKCWQCHAFTNNPILTKLRLCLTRNKQQKQIPILPSAKSVGASGFEYSWRCLSWQRLSTPSSNQQVSCAKAILIFATSIGFGGYVHLLAMSGPWCFPACSGTEFCWHLGSSPK